MTVRSLLSNDLIRAFSSWCLLAVRHTHPAVPERSYQNSCEIPRSRLEGVMGVEVVNFIGGGFKVNRRLPAWFLEANPFDFVLSPSVVKPRVEDFFNFTGFLAIDNNWRGWCYVLPWEGVGGCIFEEGDVEHGVNFHGWWEY